MSDAPPCRTLRPPPLRLSKESRKIRKQQVAPPPPIVIYMVPPKIIHVDQHEFMSLVQHLTGPDSISPTPNALPPASRENGGGGLPEAQLVSVETQVLDGGVEMPQESSLHAADYYNSLECLPRLNMGLLGNVNENTYLGNNLMAQEMMNLPSPNNLDFLNSFPYI